MKEETKTEQDIIRKIPVNQANFDYISKRQYGINGSLAIDIKDAMNEWASIKTNHLESENLQLREALEAIYDCDLDEDPDKYIYAVDQIAGKALGYIKPKEEKK